MRGYRLIVNADDFGASQEVNEAVILAYRKGVLTSASLMATGGARHEAVRLATENPGLAVGLHIVLVLGKSVLPHSEIPHLVDRNGNFPADPALAGLKYFFNTSARKELAKEVAAQFAWFRKTGLPLSHVDSHCHLHAHPVVFDVVVKASEEHGVRRMRVPDDDPALAARFLGALGPAGVAYTLVFRALSNRMKRRLDARGFAFPDRVYGNLLTGRMNEGYVLFVLENLQSPNSEIYFHPALMANPARAVAPSRVELQGLREFGALVSETVRERMETLGVRPAKYSDLD